MTPPFDTRPAESLSVSERSFSQYAPGLVPGTRLAKPFSCFDSDFLEKAAHEGIGPKRSLVCQ
jgi:hypothetical protein